MPSSPLLVPSWIGTLLVVGLITASPTTNAFQNPSASSRFSAVSYSGRAVIVNQPSEDDDSISLFSSPSSFQKVNKVVLYSSSGDGNDDDSSEVVVPSSSSSDQLLLGGLGTFASLVTFYSEYTLFTTGCGLPAGPFGLVGLVEGLSYLGMLGIVSYSVVTKIRTGSGLPAGPFGVLGAAEGLSFLAILAGLVVLVSQLTNYGYIPNAIPMEGGMCS